MQANKKNDLKKHGRFGFTIFKLWFKTISTIISIVILSLMLVQPAQSTTPPFWKDAGYVYNANQTPIRKILEDFAEQFGVILELSPYVKGTVNGRIAANSANEFLDRLALMRKFRWFMYSNKLYVSALGDNVVEKFGINSDSAAEAKQAIIGIGLFEPKFGWGELENEQSILLSGPAEYIKLVKKVLGKPEAKKIDSDIMIFRLKYANADDREMQYRNRVIVTPGVATILRNLLQDKRVKGSGTDIGDAVRNPFRSNANVNQFATGGLAPNPMENSRNMPMGNGGRAPSNPFSFLSGENGGETTASLDQSIANSTSNTNFITSFNQPINKQGNKQERNRVPLVEADVRMNAVIIRDDSSKKEYYQALINEFDAPPKMVEIEAMILDVNRSKMKDLGIDWTVTAGKTQIGVSAVANTSLDVANTALGAGSSILIRNLQNFYTRIRALEQSGEAYVLAKPSIITIDNLGAVLDLNRTAYIRLVGERVADVMPVTAGTLLKVTPRVINDNISQRIHLVVDIEDGELQEKEGSSTPSVQRSTISTQAIIEENQALVIGGYQSQSDLRNKQKVPFLSDIPGIGGAFTRVDNSSSSKERIFIIVPRSVSRQYKRTYGNSVDGTPLPPSIVPLPTASNNDVSSTMPQSQNGLGRIVYKAAAAPALAKNISMTSTLNNAPTLPIMVTPKALVEVPLASIQNTKNNANNDISKSKQNTKLNNAFISKNAINSVTNINNKEGGRIVRNVRNTANNIPNNVAQNAAKNNQGLTLTLNTKNVATKNSSNANSEANKYLNER
jgi:type III secretion protein C